MYAHMYAFIFSALFSLAVLSRPLNHMQITRERISVSLLIPYV